MKTRYFKEVGNWRISIPHPITQKEKKKMKKPDVPFTDLVKLDVDIKVNWSETYNTIIKMLKNRFAEYTKDEEVTKRVAETIMKDLLFHIADGDVIMNKENGGAEAMYLAIKMAEWEADGVIKFVTE